jgi:hypothetical protein
VLSFVSAILPDPSGASEANFTSVTRTDHSTVTLFARFRGLSTSSPLATDR